MAVKWVEDIDSGELFPVVEDEKFDIPEHLKDADYNEVDYDKTTKYTICELQNQLLAAQNQINEIKHDTHVDVVSESLEKSPPKIVEFSKSHFDWLNSLKFVVVVIALAVIIAFSFGGLKILSDEGVIDISVSESNHSVSVSPVLVYGKVPALVDENGMYYYLDSSSDNESETSDTTSSESDETETKNNPLINWVFRLVAVILPIFGVKLAIGFLMRTLRSA